MPMCDLFIPVGALEPEAERKLVAKVSELLVDHELRRITDLMDDPVKVRHSRERAESIAWMFVHRPEATYIAGKVADEPHYKFVITIPEGTIDDRFAPEISKNIFAALQEAEGEGRKHLSQRLWIHIHEVLDGRWCAGDRPMPLKAIIDYVAPGWGDAATARFDAKRGAGAAPLSSDVP